MSKIDKLLILGVRSFDHTRSETIQFETPLTLIVGYNGSGKTTIIECLKYITTGQLPPNSSKSGAWIHDPKLAGEKEVMAQVKLSFLSTTGAKMVISRSLQLTVKKTTKAQKTLEGTLLMLKNGERTTISSRVAELDTIIPQYLGVSTAILDYVIFCHQDESLWPMSEPAALKKRFDEIFEAMKYTRAIDNLKVLRKKQNEELAKLKIIEQHAKDDKDKGERAEKRSTELYNEIEELRAQNQELAEQIRTAAERCREAYDEAAKFEKIVAKLEGKRIEAQAMERNINELREHLKETTDSDAALQAMLDSYEERISMQQEENNSYKRRYQELGRNMENNRQALGAKQSEVGKYEAQKEQYEHQLGTREKLVKESARRHDIRGFDFEITDDHVREFMERIRKMARDQNAAFERARRETQEELQKAQRVLNQLYERRSALGQNKENARSQIVANDRRIEQLQSNVDKINVDEGGKAILESKIEDIEKRLSQAKSELESANWDQQIQEAEARLRSLDERKDNLDAELIEATRQAGESARLDFLQKELKGRQRDLDTLTATYNSKLSDALRQTWEPPTLDQLFQSVLKQRNSEVQDAELQRDGINREKEQIEFKLSTARNDLKRKRVEMLESEQIIRGAIPDNEPDEFLEVLESIETDFQIAKQDASNFEASKKYFEQCLSTLREHNTCRLCRRGVKDQKEKSSLIRIVQQLIDRNNNTKEAENELKQMEADLQEVKGARSSYDTWVRLKENEIPSLESNCQDLEACREKLLRELEGQDQAVKERRDAQHDLESFSKQVQNITNCHSEIISFEQQIEDLTARQRLAGQSRGLEKIQDDLKVVNEQSRSGKASLNQLTTERDRARSQANMLELELRDANSKLSTALYQLKEKGALLSQIDDLKSLNRERQETIGSIDSEMSALLPEISQAQARYDDINQRGAERDRQLQQEATKLTDSVRQLTLIDEEINAYIDRGGPQQLKRTQREIDALQEEISQIENEQRQITTKVKALEDQLRSHEDTKRSIKDNLRYRVGLRDLQEVKAEIERLESHNAEVDKDRYELEGNKWQMERNKLSAEQASIMGTLKSKDDQLRQLIEDWETDYKDAAYKYKEAHIKVETTKAAVEDLGRYGSALDKAIMSYHSLKMEEINRIIEELWRKTYQGTDVDTIMIRSDNENVKGNKSYNYRVVMVKQDAEMDMRGRCSAGQKVLASIIIRLALAECFGVNCGLIALDEPTTNLDRENIRALAESLAEIIRVRRQQKNFQLIVITHDEDFLRYMQCADFCDTYYRVSRSEKQKSIIERNSVAGVI